MCDAQEIEMHKVRTLNRDFEVIAWGMLCIWWGINVLFASLPSWTWVIGTGLILLGLNVARLWNGIPTNNFSVTLGILALVWGGLELVQSALRLPFELPILAILVIVLGVILLARGVPQIRSA